MEELLKKYPQGIYKDMPENEYHAHPAMGSTDCKHILEKEAVYKWMKEHPEEKSSPMVFGTAAHTFLLQRDLFCGTYHIIEAENKTRTEWKAGVIEAKKIGKLPLLQKEYEAIVMMASAVSEHKFVSRLMKNGFHEESHIAFDEEAQVLVKARADFRGIDENYGHYVIDYKTTKKPLNKDIYTKHFASMSYDLQCIHYKRVIELTTKKEIDNFFMLVQMATPPYLVRLFRVTDEWAAEGDSLRARAWGIASRCQKTRKYPGYEEELFEDLDIIPAFRTHQFE